MYSFLDHFRRAIALPRRRFARIDAEVLEERIMLSATVMLDVAAVQVDSLNAAMFPAPDEALTSLQAQPVMIAEHVVEARHIDESPSEVRSTNDVKRLELVFINADTPDYQALLDDLMSHPSNDRDIAVYLLDAERDGIEQIGSVLAGYKEVDAVHLVSHAENDGVKLGSTWLNENSLSAYAGELADWRSSLAADADLLLYGCDLAADEAGRTLLDGLHELTGADIAASIDATGHRAWNGNWELEYTLGSIQSEEAFSEQLQSSWQGKLATLTVTTFADTVNGSDGLLSLREAVIQANAGSGGDTIVLASGTYSLSRAGAGEDNAATGDLDLRKSVSIVGAGLSTIIDANGIDRVFHVVAGSASISELTLREGNAGSLDGGGLFVSAGAGASLDHVAIVSNRARSGGGVFSDGTLNLFQVLVDANTAGIGGGGLSVLGSSTLVNAALVNNSAVGNGGGIEIRSGMNFSATNVTVSGNSAGTAGGGLHVLSGTVNLQNATITNNSAGATGGGINVGGSPTVSLRNTIVAGNASHSDLAGSFVSQGYNLIGNLGSASGFTHGSNNDQVGSSGTPLDPQLGTLGYHGGFTPTHRLATGSTAMNTGTTVGAMLFDQRGFARSGATDIGAYELSATTIAAVGEFRVHAGTPGTQTTELSSRGSPRSVAMAADGSYVVVWSDDSFDGNGKGVVARQYNANGTANGAAFRVNSTTLSDQTWAGVTSDDSGRFVVAWTADDGSNTGIYLKRFHADGSAIDASDVLVNWQATNNDQVDPSIAMNNAGQIAIAWSSSGGTQGVFAKLFSMSTVATSSQVPSSIITVASGSGLSNAVVDINGSGKFVVVWQEVGDTKAQRFDAGGTARGGAIDLSTFYNTRQATVAIQESGDFVVAYRYDENFLEGVWYRRYKDDGNPYSVSIKVSSGTSHTAPSLSMDASGDFLVVYQGDGDGSNSGVFGRLYNASGVSQGSQFQINESTSNDQFHVSAAMAGPGNYVAVWSGAGDRSGQVDSAGVFARQFGSMAAVVNASPVGANDNYTLAEDGTLTAYADWFDSAWSTRRRVTFNNSSGAALGYQGVLVSVDSSNIDYGLTQNAGQDLRFVDADGTLLEYEIETWNESGTSLVWVRVPMIDAASSTDFIWMYYGNSSAVAGQNAGSVWSSNVKAVLHMGNPLVDSSSSSNTVTNDGSLATTGFIGNARAFDGIDDSINLGSSADVDNLFQTGGTVSAWIRPTGWGEGGYGRIADKASTLSGGDGWALQLNGSTRSIMFEYGFSSQTGRWETAADSVALNAWQMVTVVYDASSTSNVPKIYMNGVELAVSTASTPSGAANSDAANNLTVGNFSQAASRTFDGAIDEFRVFNSALSTARIDASYRAGTGSLVSFGTLQTGRAGVLKNDSDVDSANVTATLVAGPANASSFTLNNDGSFVYQPRANYFGTDGFTYLVGDGTSSDGPIQVVLNVTSVNDPVSITSLGGGSSASINLAENQTTVTDVAASDPDLPAQTLTYSLAGGTDVSRFSINASTGRLTFLTPINFEMPSDVDGNNTYQVTVAVSDGNGSIDSQNLTIAINDVDEFDVSGPVDSNSTINAVNENASNGSVVGITAFASDADGTNNTVVYSLTNNAGGRFAINAGGVVTVANGSLLNREATGSHTITVRATSADGSTAGTNFTIVINDVDEFDVVIPNDVNSAVNTVTENAANGTLVGITASASDADATTNAITYSLDDSAGGRFSINPSSGVVSVAGAVDRETHSQHTIVVRATSADGSSSTRAFTIAVAGVNDNLPAFTSSQSASVAEHQLFVTQLAATDADQPTQAIAFSIRGGADAANFEISPTNELLFRQRPNFDAPGDADADNHYAVVVRASDGAGGHTDQALLIQVTDVNDSPTVDNPIVRMAQGETYTSSSGYLLATASDEDGDALAVTLMVMPSHGTANLQSDGTYDYTPVANFLGSDTFVFEVSDGQGGVTQGVVTIQVNPGIQPTPQPTPTPTPTPTPAPTPLPTPTPAPTPDNSSVTITDSTDYSSDSTNDASKTSDSNSGKSTDSSSTNSTTTTNQITSLAQTGADDAKAHSNASDNQGKNNSVVDASSRANATRIERTTAIARANEASFEYRVIREVSRQAMAGAAEQAEALAIQRVDLVVGNGILWNDLDVLREQITTRSDESPLTLGTATGVASSLSVGYVIWLLRSGYIVAGVMAQLPAWGLIDPLPILSQLDDLDDDDDDSLAALVEKSNDEHEPLWQEQSPNPSVPHEVTNET